MSNLPEPGRPIPRVRLGSPVALPYKVNLSRKVYRPHEWTAVPRHPSIAAQPANSVGRQITFMHPYKGVVHVGYGDWSLNTGPMDVVGYDALTAEPVTFLRGVPTEAFERVREYDGALYLPWADPLGGDHTGGFATNEGGEWHNERVGPMIHTLDMIKWKGSFYVCGSAMHDDSVPADPIGKGIVYRRKNGAWVTALEGIERAGMTRFYKFWVDAQGRLCVEEEVTHSTWRTWRTADGVVWTPDPVGYMVHGATAYSDKGRWDEVSGGTPFPFNPAQQGLRGMQGCRTERHLWTYDNATATIYRTPLLL